VATDLRGGGSFNSTFLRRSFLNLTVKNYENWFTFATIILKIKVVYFFLIHGVNQHGDRLFYNTISSIYFMYSCILQDTVITKLRSDGY